MTFGNPFEENTEAPAVAENAPAAAPVVAPTHGSDEAVTLTLKEGGGFDAAWIVLKAPTVEGALALLDDAKSRKLGEQVKAAAEEFRSGSGGNATRQANAPTAPHRQTPAKQAAPSGHADPNAPAGSCEHGALVLNEWQWNGKQMRRYQCPTKTANRGKGGCDAKVWADKVQAPIPF